MAKNSYEKPDFWSQKAFSEGYPARSVYKLKEIDEKFGFIKNLGYVIIFKELIYFFIFERIKQRRRHYKLFKTYFGG